MTEIDDLLRLLLSRGGQPRLGLAASAFSPNTEQGACPGCKGLGSVRRCSPERLVTDPDQPLFAGAMQGHKTGRFHGEADGQYAAILQTVGEAMGIDFSVPWSRLDARARDVAMHGTGETVWTVVWKFRRNRREGTHEMHAPWLGLARYVEQEYERKHADPRSEAIEPLMVDQPCTACHGDRIGDAARSVLFAGLSFGQWEAMAVSEALRVLREIDDDPASRGVDGSTAAITRRARESMQGRLQRLFDAGLGYLSLGRAAPTLSNGEAQRVRIASHVDTGLTGITYVLDEPTRGLHARDTHRLVGLLRALCEAGNTVVVVEHDLEVMRAADHLIDLGPGAGDQGGKVEAVGTPAQVQAVQASRTGQCLRDGGSTGSKRTERKLRAGIEIRGAFANNLKEIDVDLPAGGLVAITGVSGSGKTSLALDVIATSLQGSPCGCRAINVLERFDRVVLGEELSAAPGPTSIVATRTGVFDDVRALFASTELARARGWRKDHFSLGSRGGRCEACQGAGRVRIGLDFLPDAWVVCEACEGSRYHRDALECLWEGRSIGQVLGMSVDEAGRALAGLDCASRLATMREVGLGYLGLGQRMSTLSGGERQRLSLALALQQGAGHGARLVILDEPTCGLHPHDVARLLPILHALVDSGDTVVVVEHDLSVIRQSDHVIDLGPEGGDQGGRIVVQGSPEEIARCASSATGRALLAQSKICPQ